MVYEYDKVLDNILDSNTAIITSAEAQAAGATRPTFSNYAVWTFSWTRPLRAFGVAKISWTII